jgi:hypothetical protein
VYAREVTMTARIGRTYSQSEAGKAANQGPQHFFTDRRARLRERLRAAFMMLAWIAAILALMATFWTIL